MALMSHKSTSTADMPAATRSGDMLDRMSDRAEDLADRAAPVLDRWASRAQDSMHHGVDAMRDASDRLRRQANHASDMTVGYIQHEPVKSVLIAAAAGAALIGIAALLARSHHS
jgi:ElaB/YqjD/DUF883 family membrane-anchored ribosome-binding protein